MHLSELEETLQALRDGEPDVAPGRDAVARRHQVRRRRLGASLAVAVVVVLVAAVAVVAVAGPDDPSGQQVVAGPGTTVPLAPAVALCFPTLTSGVPSTATNHAVHGWPDGQAPLLALTAAGELWVVDGSHATLWTAGDVAPGYLWARWASDGTIYASRVTGSAVQLEHLTAPGQASVAVTLPFTVSARAPAGHCAIDGYLAGFSIGPEGLLLVKHLPGPIPHSCPATATPDTDPWRCASPEATSYEVRARDFTAKGTDPGLSSGSSSPRPLVADSTDSSTFGVAEGADGHELLVVRPDLPATCCYGGQTGVAFALSPDGHGIAVATDQGLVLLAAPAPLSLWTSPDPVTAMAWSGDHLAVGHGGTVTLVSTVDGQARDLAGFAIGPIATLDWLR